MDGDPAEPLAAATATANSPNSGGALTVSVKRWPAISSPSAGTAAMNSPSPPRFRRLEGDIRHAFHKQLGHRRRAAAKLYEETAIPRLGSGKAERRGAGAESSASARRGTIAANRASVCAWGRLRHRHREDQFKPTGQRHADVGTGQRLKIGNDPDRRASRMTGDIKRQDDRVLIAEIIKAERVEPLRQRPSDSHDRSGVELSDRSMTGARPASPGVRQ